MLRDNHRPLRLACLIAALLLANESPRAAEPDAKEKAKPNRLAKESSPYLLQHAHNPVDWYPWGSEAFEKAKKEKKIIFLSIGYSSCHWCHVMEKESFTNQEVADLLNKNFVCIKVDREERPNVDDIYMNALHVMGARGGWPLSMFLTPDGKPIVGGTYWPREDREIDGQTANGFKTILKTMLKFWSEQPKKIEEQAAQYAEATVDALARSVRGNPIVDLDRALAKGAAEALTEELDPVHGGLGRKANSFRGTKFPSVSSLDVLLDHAVRNKDDDLRELVVLTLDRMAMGGIYDQIGGGFHRYSTERTWTVPHFEKMLYDNAQLVEFYTEAFKQWKDPAYARVVRETLAFVQREMTSPDGGFYSALDADSNGAEGEFYVWTPDEIEKVLGDKADAALIRDIYGVSAHKLEEKFFILRLKKPIGELAKDRNLSGDELAKKLEPLKAKLLEYRGKRARPFLDTKILTAWNGQMIAAYAKAGDVLKDSEYVKTAARAADFLLKNLRTPDGRLLRTYGKTAEGKWEAKLNGYLDDYAFLVHGLLNLHDATGDKRWLDEAKSLTELVVKWHGDGDNGGYFYTSSDHEKLFARPKEYYDNAQPSANGVFVRNLVRIWQKTKDDSYRKLAEKSFRQFAGVMKSNPSGVPTMCFALNRYLDNRVEKEEAKRPTGEETTTDVVKIAAASATSANGKQMVIVTVTIAAPWHIYANPTGNDNFTNPTAVTIRSNGKVVPAEVVYPEGIKVEDKDVGPHRVYKKEVVLKATLPGDKIEGPLEVSVKLQACSDPPDARCLRETTLKTVVK